MQAQKLFQTGAQSIGSVTSYFTKKP